MSSPRPEPTAADYDAAARLLTSGGPVTMLAHVSPDADALGSALAVGLGLADLGHEVRVSFGDEPFAVPRSLRWLPGLHLVQAPDDVPAEPAVAASFDVSSADRLGSLRRLVDDAGEFLAVDHHASFTGFGGHHLVDVTAPATAVMALTLLDHLGATLTPDIATCLYAGLLTDTGSFRFAATSPSTHEVAARLLGTGIEHERVGRLLYDDEPFGALRLLGVALDRAVLDSRALAGLGIVSTAVTRDDREGFALSLDATERIIDTLRVASEAEVAVVLKEDDLGHWRVSTRSKGRVDVGAACISLGGGGHRYAAGVSLQGHAADVLDRVRAALSVAVVG